MIDCLYNITALLEDPSGRGPRFRASGYWQILQSLTQDEQRYGGDPVWDAYIEGRRKSLDFDMRANRFSTRDVTNAPPWPTLSVYLRFKKKVPFTPHQLILRKLQYGFWKEYSGMAHATFQGLIPTGQFFSTASILHEDRSQFDDISDAMISMHLKRVVGILLCILTEVQAHFRFEGAHINQRLHNGWDAVLAAAEIKELYDQRYEQLMKDHRIEREDGAGSGF